MNQTEMLRSVSRTFTLSIERLPSPLRDAVAVSYLLLRVSDILEDNALHEPTRKADLLRLWADVVEGTASVDRLVRGVSDLDPDDPEAYVAHHADRVLGWLDGLVPEAQQPIVQRVSKTSRGMARWQEHGPYVADEAEMDDYMHEVAGRVGYLITDLFAWYSPRIAGRHAGLLPLSREYGLALQTVNVIRGMRKDYERGWVFVPVALYERHGLTRDSLFDIQNLDIALGVVRELADKASRHLQHGLEYVQSFPRRQHGIRLACMWPLLFAARTLALSRDNPEVLLTEAKMTRSQVTAIVRDTTFFGWSNLWLNRYYEQLIQPPDRAEAATA